MTWPLIKPSDFILNLPLPASAWSKIRFVYFDIGNVLIDLHWDAYFQAWEEVFARHHVTKSQFMAILGKTQATKDWALGNIGPARYFEQIKAALEDTFFVKVTEPEFDAIDLKNLSSLIVGPVRLGALRLVRELKSRGIGVGVLSNAVPWHETDIEATLHLRDIFDVVCFSQDLGCEKPQPIIYQKAHARAHRWTSKRGDPKELDPKEVVFVDDLPENVTSATDFGWNALHLNLLKDPYYTFGHQGLLKEEECVPLCQSGAHFVHGEEAVIRLKSLLNIS
jgi:HAD superfamily hydrolase (TIGR01509 family)